MISLLITVLILALIMYLVFWALGQLALPQPIRAVIIVIVAIILILILTQYLPTGYHLNLHN
jgi:hypothetical protein